MTPTRRAVLFTGAATATAALLPLPSATAAGPGSPAALPAATPPLASYWYPDSLPSGEPGAGITWRGLRDWRAEDDPDLAFNASTVPLAPRFTPAPVNDTARAGQARIQSLVSFGPTSGNPSQGSATADHYALTHWAYLDELVFWGGSAGEGLILAPNAPIVDAAHRHGVRVLGNVFLPPVAYGGQLRWTRDLVRKDSDGHYPLAERLVAVAAAYGFDGWFVNAETGGGDAALGADMLGFMTELKSLAAARGQRVTWYDAMTVNGSVSWQGALDSGNEAFFEKADDMFVDFRWSASSLASSGQLAEQLGRDRYELWAGVDVEASGWNRFVNWDAIVPANAPHVTSLGFYRPEWTRNHLPADHTPAEFHAADDRFWTGRSLDPAHPDTTDGWRAPALSVADRSTVSSVPFASTFNTGHGLRWYEAGRVTSEAPWNHLGLQDRLPSRRWVVRTEGARPQVAFDFEDAWRGGSSVLVSGTLTAPVTLDLYATRLPLRGGAVVDLAYREDGGGAAVAVELAVATAEPAAGAAPPYTYLPVRPRHHGRVADGWRTATVRLPGRSGSVHALGVRLTAADGTPVAWRLGALAVRRADRPDRRPAPPTGLRITAASGGDLRFGWRPARGPVRQYTLHRVLSDGTRRFLGGTCQHAFFVPGLVPGEGERTARFEVRTVGEVYTASSPAHVTHTW
ncbi:endo-beta-N-acetylglucosaminidase D [Streptomyces sp. B3I7]|uniref:endo-beta-N-acetylglucosaminidase n=1 Tax=unclassified Streptomyces TaxID=2593676 RepID=UPI002786A0E5|nr:MULTISPECIES: endo-beta-N-acetylglucosaminidase [unclassified Streptomyces]MDQ0791104.1 endo-beta-N-acetylglucosaminidase D [Streptomyces sp. B3I8]MDQ0809176.1 endo-beta-N-acetylglucosaminidase D [Streptomyces sp. B3I7]